MDNCWSKNNWNSFKFPERFVSLWKFLKIFTDYVNWKCSSANHFPSCIWKIPSILASDLFYTQNYSLQFKMKAQIRKRRKINQFVRENVDKGKGKVSKFIRKRIHWLQSKENSIKFVGKDLYKRGMFGSKQVAKCN